MKTTLKLMVLVLLCWGFLEVSQEQARAANTGECEDQCYSYYDTALNGISVQYDTCYNNQVTAKEYCNQDADQDYDECTLISGGSTAALIRCETQLTLAYDKCADNFNDGLMYCSNEQSTLHTQASNALTQCLGSCP